MKDDVPSDGACRKFGLLVVDDDEAVLDVLDYGLKLRGFGVWRAIDGRSALRTYGRYHEQIDIVLLDVRLPDLDGPQTLTKLRKLSTRFHCCFMSGDLGGYTEQALLDMGALAVFRKPLNAVELGEKLMKIATDPRLNPTAAEARRRANRRPPARQPGAPKLEFVLRTIGGNLPRPMSQFHGDHPLRWTGWDDT
jgi:DNA-binding response OmpR family regulator